MTEDDVICSFKVLKPVGVDAALLGIPGGVDELKKALQKKL